MRNAVVILALVLAGCSSVAQKPPAEPLAPAPTRELSKQEKDRLRVSLARALPDPASAQFKWVPVALREREGLTDYCGLVNAKKPGAGFVGFTPFFARLQKSATGQFEQGEINLLANPEDPAAINATAAACRQNGYADITGAR